MVRVKKLPQTINETLTEEVAQLFGVELSDVPGEGRNTFAVGRVPMSQRYSILALTS